MKIHARSKIFMWRLVRNILPTRSRLISKNIQVGNGCYLFNEESENIWHLFYECPYALATLGFLWLVGIGDQRYKRFELLAEISTNLPHPFR